MCDSFVGLVVKPWLDMQFSSKDNKALDCSEAEVSDYKGHGLVSPTEHC